MLGLPDGSGLAVPQLDNPDDADPRPAGIKLYYSAVFDFCFL
jgi:hypothetical protein